MNFIDDLPHKMKVEISLFIHEKRYKKIKFFKNKTISFITWLCPLLRPQTFEEYQYIYSEGEEIISVFFLVGGGASFVLPSYDNVAYINIQEGDNFGIIDILGSVLNNELDIDDWMIHKDVLAR